MHVEKENFIMPMGMCMRENGLMIKQTEKECISIKVEQFMMDIGRMIYNMAMEKRYGLMAVNTMESIIKDISMELAPMNGKMAVCIVVNGSIVKYMAWDNIDGQMAENSSENGKTTVWMVLVFIFGLMEEYSKENIEMIKKKDLVYMFGLTIDDIKVGGTMANNMV